MLRSKFLVVYTLILKVSQCYAKNSFLKINRLELKRWAGLGGAHHQFQNSSVRGKQNCMTSWSVQLLRHNFKTEINKQSDVVQTQNIGQLQISGLIPSNFKMFYDFIIMNHFKGLVSRVHSPVHCPLSLCHHRYLPCLKHVCLLLNPHANFKLHF